MDRTNVLRLPALLLAGTLLLVPPPASPSDEGGVRTVNLRDVLLPHVMEGVENALFEDFRQIGTYHLTDAMNFRGGFAFDVATWSGGFLGGGHAGSLFGTMWLGPGVLVGLAIASAINLYITPASVRTWYNCYSSYTPVCDLEDDSLYVLVLGYSISQFDLRGRCLLFVRHDADEGLLRWEVDRCLEGPGGVFFAKRSPYAQNEDGGLRTGGWTGFLDWPQGHRDVVARGAVDLETGEAVPGAMH